MAKIDYYQILGVSPDASIKAIKRAYRRLAVQYHPDKNPGDQAAHDQFQQISEAYAVLSDLQQRAAYDRRQNFKPQQESPLHTPQTKQERKKRKGKWINLFFFRGKPKPQRGFRAKKSPHRIALSGFNQFFGGFFSKPVPQKPKPAGPIRGANLQQDLELLLHEVAQGCRKQIDVQHEELCALCSGTGALHSARMRRCTRCKGSGVVEFEQGHFVVKQRCPRCYGEGNEIVSSVWIAMAQAKSRKHARLLSPWNPVSRKAPA
jgi:molecular chaperone DnaJ